jgi:hypothetical protein
MDSSTIDLCMNLFPWALFRSDQVCGEAPQPFGPSGGAIPAFTHLTDGETHDTKDRNVSKWGDYLLTSKKI